MLEHLPDGVKRGPNPWGGLFRRDRMERSRQPECKKAKKIEEEGWVFSPSKLGGKEGKGSGPN